MATGEGASSQRPLTVIVPKPPTYRGGTEEYAYQLVRAYSTVRPVRVVTTTASEGTGKEALSIEGPQADGSTASGSTAADAASQPARPTQAPQSGSPPGTEQRQKNPPISQL